MLNTLKRKIALVAVAALGSAGLAVVAAPSAFAASPGTITTDGLRAGASKNVNVITLTGADFADGDVDDNDTSVVRAIVVAGPTGVDLTSTAFDYTGVSAGITTNDPAAGATYDIAMGSTNGAKSAFPLAGNYQLFIWLDTDADGNADTAETFGALYTVTVGGAATSISLDATSGSAPAADNLSRSQVLATVTLKDAAGNPTMLNDLPTNFPERLAVTMKDATGATVTASSNGAPEATLAGNNMTLQLDNNSNLASGAAVYTITVTNSGALANTLSATYTLSAKAVGTVSAIALSTADAAKAIAAADSDTEFATANEVAIPAGATSLTVTATTAAADEVALVYFSDGDSTTQGLSGVKVNGLALTPSDDPTAASATATAITGADLKATFVITFTAAVAGKSIAIAKQTNHDDNAGAEVGVRVAFQDPAVTVNGGSTTLTVSPAQGTAVIAASGGTVPVIVTVADQFSAAVAGYTVKATNVDAAGTSVDTIGVTGADGTVTLNVAAPSATSATGSITLFARAPGAVYAAIGGGSAITVTYQADPSPTTLLAGFADVAGTATSDRITLASTQSMIIETVSTGLATAVAATAVTTADGLPSAAKNAVRIYVNSVASSLVTLTGSAGVCLTTTDADTTDVATKDCKNTATIAASGTDSNVWAYTAKAGTHTVTAKSGSKSVTLSFTAVTIEAAARNISVDKKSITTASGEYTTVTVTVTDAWGNPVKISGGQSTDPSIAVSVVGVGLINGFNTAVTLTEGNAAGQHTFNYFVPQGQSGKGTITITAANGTGPNGQFGALAGTADPAATTAGTNEMPASVKSLTIEATSTAAAASSPALDAVKSDVKAVSDTVATLSKDVTTIQSSVTELTTTFTAQIKSLSSAISRISKAIAALSKRIK